MAAPVEVGIIDMVAARARYRSLWKTSSRFWSLVKEWIVVMWPRSMPTASFSTLATGARQLVVQDALLTTVCSGRSWSWLTP